MNRRPVSADQIRLIVEDIRSFFDCIHPSVNDDARVALAYGLLYQVIDTANLYFQDDIARQVATPPLARMNSRLAFQCQTTHCYPIDPRQHGAHADD